MKFDKFSKKQLKAMFWWCNKEISKKYDTIICDGAIRSGKTVCMLIGFIFWSMSTFNGYNFGICGKTVGSAIRNIINPLLATTSLRKLYNIKFIRNQNLLIISTKTKVNYYYIFGGKDEGSYTLIQGITLAGVFLDEAVLMPRSFVEQAIGRCSVEGARFWFNCNPDKNNYHWFYKEWIAKCEEKRAYHIHFLMTDNPGNPQSVIDRYLIMFPPGIFRDRYIYGMWVAADGLVYPMFSDTENVIKGELPNEFQPSTDCEYYVSVDYGTMNPHSMGLWCYNDSIGEACRIKEYYYSGRETKIQKTDEEYYVELCRLTEGYKIKYVIVDPSAASFIACIRRHNRFKVVKAGNSVNSGIQNTSTMIYNRWLKIHESCTDFINEVHLYSWNEEKTDKEVVIKQNDHSMDDTRYFVNTILINKRAVKNKLKLKPNSAGED